MTKDRDGDSISRFFLAHRFVLFLSVLVSGGFRKGAGSPRILDGWPLGAARKNTKNPYILQGPFKRHINSCGSPGELKVPVGDLCLTVGVADDCFGGQSFTDRILFGALVNLTMCPIGANVCFRVRLGCSGPAEAKAGPTHTSAA